MTSYLRSIFGGYPNHPTTPPIQTTTSSQTLRSRSHSRSHSVPTINGATTAYIYSNPSATSTSSYPHPHPRSKCSQSFPARATGPSPLRFGTHEPGAGGYPVSEDGRYHSVLLPCRASYKTSDHGEPNIVLPSAQFHSF